MASTPVLGAVAALFVIAALLFWQSQQQGLGAEGFRSLPPIAGRPYGAAGENPEPEDPYFVPGDLSKAPIANAAATVPAAAGRPSTVPGPAAAPRDLPATQKDLQELDMRLVMWLEAVDQIENENPGALTPEQRHQRVIYQARIATIRDQIGTGMITDTARVVSQEIADMRRENAAFRRKFPNLEELHSFGVGRAADAFLDADEYREFRGLFEAGIKELKDHPQPDQLERLRFQQLQVFQQEIRDAQRSSPAGLPPIRMGAARLFLRQMLKPDQPLPTLFAMESPPSQQEKPYAESTADIVAALKDVEWQLTISHDPAEQELKRAVAGMLTQLQRGGKNMTPHQVHAARAKVAALRNMRTPAPASVSAASWPGAPWPSAKSLEKVDYDPSDLVTRARTLCKQMEEAFGKPNAQALGCPAWGDKALETETEAENAINTVCDRLRYSVPTVDPAQFNCPKRHV